MRDSEDILIKSWWLNRLFTRQIKREESILERNQSVCKYLELYGRVCFGDCK